MTTFAASDNEKVVEKVSVFGVNLEVLRIAPAHEDASPNPIVFLHEGLGSVAMWRDFPKQLCDATGRPGLVYSRQGYGRSDGVFDACGVGRFHPDYMHREAWEVLPELMRIEGIQRPVLLGHSDGGTIALMHAAKFETEACIVMAPHLFVEDISVSAIRAARQAFETSDLRQRLSKFHANVDTAFWRWNDVWLSDAFRRFNIEVECQKITCPILAIQGHDDPYGTMAQINGLDEMEADFSRINGLQPANNMRRVLLKLEQCGHSPHKDQSTTVMAAIHEWLGNNLKP